MISFHFQGKPFNITVIQVYAPTSNAEEAELEWFYEVPGSSVGKESACNARDPGSISGLGRSPGEENGNPFHYSCLGSPMDRGAWWATVHGVARVKRDLVTEPPEGGEVEAVTDFISLGSQITAEGDCNHEIKRCLLFGRKAMTNQGSRDIKKQRHYFAYKGPYSQSYNFSRSHVWM